MRNRINIPKNMFSTKRIAKELFQSKRRTEGNILTNNTLSFCIKGSFFNSDNALGYDLVFREEKVKVEISRAFISNIILNSGCAWSVYWRLLSSFYLWTFFYRRNFFQGKMILHYGDLIDGNCLVHIINTTKPTEIYNLGAQSHVKVAFMAMLQLILLMWLFENVQNRWWWQNSDRN